jgi:hypothetical protein
MRQLPGNTTLSEAGRITSRHRHFIRGNSARAEVDFAPPDADSPAVAEGDGAMVGTPL